MSTLTDIEERYTFILHNPIFRDDWYIIGHSKNNKDINPLYLYDYFKVQCELIFCIKSMQNFSDENFLILALEQKGYKLIDLVNGCKLINISQSDLISIVYSICGKSNSNKIIENNSKIDFLDIDYEIERITNIANSFKWQLQDDYYNFSDQDFGDTTPYYIFDDDYSEQNNNISEELKEIDDIKDKLFQVRDYYEDLSKDVDSYMTLAVMDLWKAFLKRRKS